MADLDIAPIAFRRCSRCRLWKQQTLENFTFARKRQAWSSRCRPCAVAAAQEHYWADPEKKKAYANARYKANPERSKAQARQWALDNPERVRENSRRNQAKYHHAMRAEVLDAYGNRCACCGLSEHPKSFLTLFRADGHDGPSRDDSGGELGQWKALKRLGWPTESYWLLCWNCSLSTRYGGACAHTAEYREPKPKHLADRRAVIEAYGGACACCGLSSPLAFLSIEHTKRDGGEHRKSAGGNSYRDLVRRGCPADEGITILCYNCNMARSYGRSCPHERGRQLALSLSTLGHDEESVRGL